MKRYKVVATSDAQPGMCLYEDVLDRAGNLMLPKHTLLTTSLLAALERRDVAALQIVDDGVTEAQLAQERARVKERLGRLCRGCGASRASAKLRRLVEEYLVEQLA
jgi:hypothetical protein